MAIHRIYCPTQLQSGRQISLPESASRHVVSVLRLKPGTRVVLFDGRGGEYPSVLTRVTRHEVMADIGEHRNIERESPLSVILLQGLSRGERMDFTLQKATELGVSSIIPLETERCNVRLTAERRLRRQRHWHGVIAAACEQCGRNRLPEIHELVTLQEYLARSRKDESFAVTLAPEATQSLAGCQQLQDTGTIRILAGPEGGLSPAEIELATQCGFVPVHLGPRILRTETVSLAALTALQILAGDMK